MNAPTRIVLHKKSRLLELEFGADTYRLDAEYLRVHSPSAEVKGHGPNQAVLQTGKKNVAIEALEVTGNYALKLTFSDGHNSGLYTWHYLQDLARNQESYWQSYLDALQMAGASRDADTQIVKFV
ncbi:MAG TPA: DUF971 domain-containing protein [Cellvibrionaceae bacterium]